MHSRPCLGNFWKRDFPSLDVAEGQRRKVYLDSAATTQKPRAVIDSFSASMFGLSTNVHRGVGDQAGAKSGLYEQVRSIVGEFIGSTSTNSIVFTSGATDSINLVANCLSLTDLTGRDIFVTEMEHHSNFLPWVEVCKRSGANLIVIPVSQDGSLNVDFLRASISPNTVLVAVAHVSNVLGYANDVKQIAKIAHMAGAKILVDGAQAISHMPVNVEALDCDFYVFSAHKVYGPEGVGVLYGKPEVLIDLPVSRSGGGAILDIEGNDIVYKKIPYRFEPGTPNISGVLAMGEAFKYLKKIGMNRIVEHENKLLEYALSKLDACSGVTILGTASEARAGIISFNLNGVHPHDVATVLDSIGIIVRAGELCAKPLMHKFDLSGVVRLSIGIYNEQQDIDLLISGLNYANNLLGT